MQSQINFAQVAEVKLTYKSKVQPSLRPQITDAKKAYEILLECWKIEDDLEYRERFAVLLLNRHNKVLGINWVSVGGVAGTIADPKMIFQAALLANASSIILAHNHPSGNARPSDADRSLTKKVKEAGKLLDLPVLDHVILTSETYYSFANEGEL